MRPRMAPRPLWRLPPQLRPTVDARVPARLVSRPVRPLPRQRDLNFHHETILTDGGSQGPPFLLGEFFWISKNNPHCICRQMQTQTVPLT